MFLRCGADDADAAADDDDEDDDEDGGGGGDNEPRLSFARHGTRTNIVATQR